MAAATRIADRASGAFVFSYTGTTAAQNIHLGFKPSYMILANQTDGDTICFWCKNDTAHYWTITTAVAQTTATIAQVDDGTTIGFSLGSDAVLNENAKVYVGIAWRD